MGTLTNFSTSDRSLVVASTAALEPSPGSLSVPEVESEISVISSLAIVTCLTTALGLDSVGV